MLALELSARSHSDGKLLSLVHDEVGVLVACYLVKLLSIIVLKIVHVLAVATSHKVWAINFIHIICLEA